MYTDKYAPVAQLDRAAASGAVGREFESLRARQSSSSANHPCSFEIRSELVFLSRLQAQSKGMHYDALLVVSFGGPESNEEVIPFLENVLRGKNVPRERMLAVAEHYYHFGGKSPINQQNRELIEAVREELERSGPNL